jgi:hypothetical protein
MPMLLLLLLQECRAMGLLHLVALLRGLQQG